MTKLKICGLMSAQDAEYANAVQPELAGVVFAKGRRRCVTQETARAIRRALDRRIPLVGVFVDAQVKEISALAEKGIIQLVQLHGQEDAAYLLNLRKVCTLPVIRAYSIRSAGDLRAAAESDADIVLLDSGIGGTGETFDHTLLNGFPRPYFLAGGLTPENAAETVNLLHPYGVDVSSGVETDGRKDAQKMQAFAAAVRQTNGTI
ncbi:MAG: phosphoribosylanthranilate isomerase [Oscillospiraceae bacterium]|nr:phosphoribosylanthranilate isomerase [Oscillospiraceae bacterium]